MASVGVVTGASTGIGRAVAIELARAGYDVVLAARRGDKLRETASAVEETKRKAHVLTLDVTKHGAADEALAFARRHGQVEVLVNNAGFGIYGAFSSNERGEVARMLDTNVRALTDFTAAFLPEMLGHKKGFVLNVASTAGFQPLPFTAAYAASKSYVLSFGEALAAELRGTGVSVATLCPGPTESEFWEVGKYTKDGGLRDVPGMLMMPAEKVARAGVRAMLRRKTLAIPGLSNRASALAGRLAPRSILTGVVSTVIRPRK